MEKCHYFGEFGCFNMLLGKLNYLLLQRLNLKLDICTYNAYGKLLQYLFPKNVRPTSIEWNFKEELRGGDFYHDESLVHKLSLTGFQKNLLDLIETKNTKNVFSKETFSKHFYKKTENKYFYLNSPIKCGRQHRKPKYISIFPRWRSVSPKHNLNKESWQAIVNKLKKYPYNIVIHGVDTEFIELDIKNAIRPKNILDQVHYLNNSLLLITPTSGVAQFALNCNCPVFVVDRYYGREYKFNPFNNSITMANLKQIKKTQILENFIEFLIHSNRKIKYPESLSNRILVNYAKIRWPITTYLKKHQKIAWPILYTYQKIKKVVDTKSM